MGLGSSNGIAALQVEHDAFPLSRLLLFRHALHNTRYNAVLSFHQLVENSDESFLRGVAMEMFGG